MMSTPTAERRAILDFTTPHVLRNEVEYDTAVAEIDTLLDIGPELDPESQDRLEFLSVLVEAYDREHYPMGETATPQAVVAFMLEQKGLTRADLTDTMGGRSRVSDFFSGKRPLLSRGQIVRLREQLGVPADLLL